MKFAKSLQLLPPPARLKGSLAIQEKTKEIPMPALDAKRGRDDLLSEISNVLLKWSELERIVFSQAHYRGQSLEAISRSLQLDEEKVRAILRQCDDHLYAALKDFRQHAA
jgi:DNA-directed RNA polymerase specialized sigma24 family protein